jgi:hypothetical protein
MIVVFLGKKMLEVSGGNFVKLLINLKFSVSVNLYLFTRVRNPPCTVTEAANNDLLNYNVTLNDLQKYNQEGCSFG